MNWHFEKKQFFQWCAQNGVELPKRAPQQGQETQSWDQELASLIADRESDGRSHAISKVISDLREAAFERILKTDKPCAEVMQFCFGMDALESLSMTLFDMQEPDLSWVRDADDALEQLEKHVSDDALALDFQRLRQKLCWFVNCVFYFNEQFQWLLGDVENRWRAKHEEHDRQVQEEREVLSGLLAKVKADNRDQEERS
jgi:hypothetical protein